MKSSDAEVMAGGGVGLGAAAIVQGEAAADPRLDRRGAKSPRGPLSQNGCEELVLSEYKYQNIVIDIPNGEPINNKEHL